MAYEALGNYVTAADRYLASFKIWEGLYRAEEVAAVLGRLGAVQAGAGSYADALISYRRSLAIFGEVGNYEKVEDLQELIAQVESVARWPGPAPGAE
jgi:hypothetical protein